MLACCYLNGDENNKKCSTRDLTHLTTSDLEGCNHPIPNLVISDTRSHGLDDTTEFVTQNISLLHLDDGAMEKVKIAAADCATGDLENDISIFNHTRLGYVHYIGTC